MDLAAESTRLRLDLLAVRIGGTLDTAGVPYALIKGPSTSIWLYDPPRPYSDVDVLVPLSRVHDAAAALTAAGDAFSRSGKVGEEASHSLLMHSQEGFEVDLHVSLPSAPNDGDRIWSALVGHRESLVMDVGVVTALDAVGRCLVLALHAVNSAPPSQPATDLLLARQACGPAVWDAVGQMAVSLGIADLVDGSLAVAEGREAPLSRRARLYLTHAPGAALGLQRLLDTPRRRLPAAVWQELIPSRGFMAQFAHQPGLAGRALVRAHVRRWLGLVRQLPAAWRAFRKV